MPDKTHKIRGNDPRLSEPKLRGDCRVLELDDGKWQWQTDGSKLIVYSPAGEKTVNRYLPPDEKHQQPITPGDVKVFIEQNLR